MKPQSKRADLVLAGGGVLGIGHVGVASVLEERGYAFPRLAGTSAGSIVAALLASGMRSERMHGLIATLEYPSFLDRSLVDRLPLVGPAASVLFENGFYEGDRFHEWLSDELEKLDVRTFGDLRIEDPQSSLRPEQRYRLVVMVSDLTRGELVRLPWDYGRYGLDPDDQPVADAVRASISIPYFFEPFKLRHGDGGESLLVDGGVLSNYPLDVFDRTDLRSPRWPTFGVTLIPRQPAGSTELFPVLGLLRRVPSLHFLESLITTLVVGRDQGYLAQPWVSARSIEVDTFGVNPVDFGIERETAERLYRGGRAAAEDFLSGWNWEDYKRRFRPGASPRRKRPAAGSTRPTPESTRPTPR